VATFKIFAFAKNYSQFDLWRETLLYVMKKNGEDLYGWWNSNAKYVLPSIKNEDEFHYEKPKRLLDWERLIIQSTDCWLPAYWVVTIVGSEASIVGLHI
jgi:hypothetical protein